MLSIKVTIYYNIHNESNVFYTFFGASKTFDWVQYFVSLLQQSYPISYSLILNVFESYLSIKWNDFCILGFAVKNSKARY